MLTKRYESLEIVLKVFYGGALSPMNRKEVISMLNILVGAAFAGVLVSKWVFFSKMTAKRG